MKEVRCPLCHALLGLFEGRGEIMCRKCRKGTMVIFDTDKDLTRIAFRP